MSESINTRDVHAIPHELRNAVGAGVIGGGLLLLTAVLSRNERLANPVEPSDAAEQRTPTEQTERSARVIIDGEQAPFGIDGKTTEMLGTSER